VQGYDDSDAVRPDPRAARVPFGSVTTTAAQHPVRARIGRWPYRSDVAHLVLLDHHMVPDIADVRRWIVDARAGGARSMRTGALFPPAVPAFTATGFEVIDTLSLLELDLARRVDTARSGRPPARSLSRLRRHQLDEAAQIDRQAFPELWANDREALAEIIAATPSARARCVRVDGQMVAFAISGRAHDWGYVQRLAVDPRSRRLGLARLLVVDALDWMQRRRVTRVLVNTATDNHAATALYRSCGFEERAEHLHILERRLDDR
jgi:ribosomal protein S18 acetylase RimI-like enzyme